MVSRWPSEPGSSPGSSWIQASSPPSGCVDCAVGGVAVRDHRGYRARGLADRDQVGDVGIHVVWPLVGGLAGTAAVVADDPVTVLDLGQQPPQHLGVL